MTRDEYNHTVRDLLGDSSRPADRFPAENRALGFENNADVHVVTSQLIEAYLRAAEDVAHRAMVERRLEILPCDPAITGEVLCGQMLVQGMGRLAFRRPLAEEESAALVSLFNAALAAWGFDLAAETLLQALLQAPQFLYRLEFIPAGQGDFSAPVGGYEMASRLSYFFWASMPDGVLLAAAEHGQLGTADQVEAQARRLLADPRGADGIRSFGRQWLQADLIPGLAKDSVVFPEFTESLKRSWEDGLFAFMEKVVWSGSGTLTELLTSDLYMVDAVSAPVYGAPGPTTGLAEVHAPTERFGLLTQPALMAMLAHPEQSAPVRRGVFVREHLLCQGLPPPPEDLNFQPPDPNPNATTRERFAEHSTNPRCAGCHDLMDPVGFGLENYDALGRYRATEAGRPVDASGQILYTLDPDGDPTLEGPFNGPAELSTRLAGSTQVRACMVRHWFRYAMGRGEQENDRCTLAALMRGFEQSGGNIRELMVSLARTDAFRFGQTTAMGSMP